MKRTNYSASYDCAVEAIKNIKTKIDAEEVSRGYGTTLGSGLNAIWNADIDMWENDRHVIDDCIGIMKREAELKNVEGWERDKYSELEKLAVLAGIRDGAEKEARAKVKKMAASRMNRVNKNK